MGVALAPNPFRRHRSFAFVFTDEHSPDVERKDWLTTSSSSRKFATAKIALRTTLRSFRNEKKPRVSRLTAASENVPGDNSWLLILSFVPVTVP